MFLYNMMLRAKVRDGLRQNGVKFGHALALSRSITDEQLRTAEMQVGATDRVMEINALGDGRIIEAILKFFESEIGQMLIQFLIRMLLGM
jgi:hypothetical protein